MLNIISEITFIAQKTYKKNGFNYYLEIKDQPVSQPTSQPVSLSLTDRLTSASQSVCLSLTARLTCINDLFRFRRYTFIIKMDSTNITECGYNRKYARRLISQPVNQSVLDRQTDFSQPVSLSVPDRRTKLL